MIGIIGAMDIEVEGLCAKLDGAVRETVGGLTFHTGTLHGKAVVIARCGIGKVFAAMCAQTMILRYQPECIINTGVAGALTEDLHIADIVIGRAAVQHDMDTSPLGDPVGFISGLDVIEMPADAPLGKRLAKAAARIGARTRCGNIATGDRFVADPAEKAALARNFDAIACEMEGGAIAQVCTVNRTPFALLRAISDGTGDAAMDYTTFAKLAAEQSVKLMCDFLAAE